jgi:hypothetical protein
MKKNNQSLEDLSKTLKLKPKKLKKIISDVDFSMRESTDKLIKMIKQHKEDCKRFEQYIKESK